MKVQVKLHMERGTERMEEEDQKLVGMTFRELWVKGDSEKIIWLCKVHIAQSKEVDYSKRFRGQIWKQQWDKIRGNITITNPTVGREYNRKVRRQGRNQQIDNSGRYACSENGKQRIGRDIGSESK